MKVHFSHDTEQNNSCVSWCLLDSGGTTHHAERRPYGFWFPPEQHSEEEMRRQRLRRFERR